MYLKFKVKTISDCSFVGYELKRSLFPSKHYSIFFQTALTSQKGHIFQSLRVECKLFHTDVIGMFCGELKCCNIDAQEFRPPLFFFSSINNDLVAKFFI